MREFLPTISKAPLFTELTEGELATLLPYLGARKAEFHKGQFILTAGKDTEEVGIILTGTALVLQEDFWGNRNILTQLTPGSLFAEVFACLQGTLLNVDVKAQEDTLVLWLKLSKILTPCAETYSFHSKVMHNLLRELARKNILFNERMLHMGQRTTREKVLSYLSLAAQKKQSSEFAISFNRQQLADYLCVERSALSATLSKLRKEGILDFTKNKFVLKRHET